MIFLLKILKQVTWFKTLSSDKVPVVDNPQMSN